LTKMALRTEFQAIRQEESESIRTYIDRVKAAIVRLNGANITLSEDEETAVLLNGLTPAYVDVVKAIYSAAAVTLAFPKWQVAETTLQAIESRMRIRDNTANQVAFMARTRTQPAHPSAKSKAKRDDICGHCANLGHWKAECRQLKEGKPKASDAQFERAKHRVAKLKEKKTGQPVATAGAAQASEYSFMAMHDNTGAIDLAYNPRAHGRTKHMKIRFHFIRECIQEGAVSFGYIHTTQQLADSLTKPVSKATFEAFCQDVGLTF